MPHTPGFFPGSAIVVFPVQFRLMVPGESGSQGEGNGAKPPLQMELHAEVCFTTFSIIASLTWLNGSCQHATIKSRPLGRAAETLVPRLCLGTDCPPGSAWR